MKKITLATVGAAAMIASGVSVADTTLYGSLRAAIEYTDLKPGLVGITPGGVITKGSLRRGVTRYRGPKGQTQDNWGLWDAGSRWGIKGSEDLGGGLKAIYQMEVAADIMTGSLKSGRQMWVGLKSDTLGQLTFGKQYDPFYNNVAGAVDQFNGNASLAWSFLGNTAVDGSREPYSIYYSTPNFNGASVQGMVVLDGTDSSLGTGKKGLDIWHLGASYANGPAFLGFAFARSQGTKTWTTGLSAAWNTSSWGFATSWEYINPKKNRFVPSGFASVTTSGKLVDVTSPDAVSSGLPFGFPDVLVVNKAHNLTFLGTYAIGPHTMRASYTKTLIDGANDAQYIQLGYQFNLSKRTYVWAEGYVNNTKAYFFGNETKPGKYWNTSIGFRHDF